MRVTDRLYLAMNIARLRNCQRELHTALPFHKDYRLSTHPMRITYCLYHEVKITYDTVPFSERFTKCIHLPFSDDITIDCVYCLVNYRLIVPFGEYYKLPVPFSECYRLYLSLNITDRRYLLVNIRLYVCAFQ